MDVEGDDDVPLHDHRRLWHEPVALHLGDETAQPRAEVDALAVELNEPLRVAAARARCRTTAPGRSAADCAARCQALPAPPVSPSRSAGLAAGESGSLIIERDGSFAAIWPSAFASGVPCATDVSGAFPRLGGAMSASSSSRELPRANGSAFCGSGGRSGWSISRDPDPEVDVRAAAAAWRRQRAAARTRTAGFCSGSRFDRRHGAARRARFGKQIGQGENSDEQQKVDDYRDEDTFADG